MLYSQLCYKMPEDVGPKKKRKQQTIDSAPEMGGMADIIGISSCHIPAVQKIHRCENKTRDRNGNQVDVDTHPGLEEDAGKEDGRYGAGGTDSAVVPIVPVFEKVPERGHGNSRKI